MVGIFSRFSSGRSAGHRRAQSALDEREVLPPNSEITGVTATSTAASHGIEVAVEFKPVEHPMEPQDTDRPIQCPLPEPSILNIPVLSCAAYRQPKMEYSQDGRIWKERVSTNIRRRPDLPVMKEEGALEESEVGAIKPQPRQRNRLILPSMSAPEHNLLNLLEESGI